MKIMTDEQEHSKRIKAARWLFYGSTFQITMFLLIPLIDIHNPARWTMGLLAMLTVGILFAAQYLGVNIYCFIRDKQRSVLYIILAVVMFAWLLWATITWKFIQHMTYLT